MIAVSTLAMVFAVSSSLLLFSAHRHRVHHDRMMLENRIDRRQPRPPRPAPVPAVVVRERTRAPAPAPPPPADCKGPIYRSTADGRTEVVFEQCAGRPFARR